MIKPETVMKALEEVKKKSAKRKFAQSIDLTINLNLDMTKPENRIEGEIVLPNTRGKPTKVGVIADGELGLQAKKVADRVISKADLENLAKNKKEAKKIVDEIDFFVGQAELMPLIGKHLGPVIGPRGKMPKPVPANMKIEPLVERLKKTVRIRSKEKPVIHVPVGIEGMDDGKILENIEAVLNFVETKLENGFKDINSVYLKTTMGHSVKLVQMEV